MEGEGPKGEQRAEAHTPFLVKDSRPEMMKGRFPTKLRCKVLKVFWEDYALLDQDCDSK